MKGAGELATLDARS